MRLNSNEVSQSNLLSAGTLGPQPMQHLNSMPSDFLEGQPVIPMCLPPNQVKNLITFDCIKNANLCFGSVLLDLDGILYNNHIVSDQTVMISLFV